MIQSLAGAIEFSQAETDWFDLRDNPITTDPDQLVVFTVFRQNSGILKRSFSLNSL
jgi:hypothetical protein